MEILLTIIISSHNRCDLLIKNLELMLRSDTKNIEFLVCDNGSSDGTWERLSAIEDDRLVKNRNLKDYGFENFWLMSFHARGKYFLFLNDRDRIPEEELSSICDCLSNIKTVDFISCDRKRYKKGYYIWKEAIDLFFQSRHPGTLIYNRNFCQRVLDRKVILDNLEHSKPELANNYIVFQVLFNVNYVYAYSTFKIVQPLNRELIRKERTEYYDSVYLSLGYRIHDFYDKLLYAQKYTDNLRTIAILKSVYKDSLITVTREYYYSLKIPKFKERNNCETLRARQWITNAGKLCAEFYNSPLIPYPSLKHYIVCITPLEVLKTFLVIIRGYIRTILPGFV